MANAYDLCTLADVRLRMQKAASDTAQDALISAFIGPASKAIMRWCEREFAPASTAVARVFEWPWEGEFVSFAPYDLRGNPTSVQVDTDSGSPVMISTDEYRLWPQPPKDGTYGAIRLRPFSVNVGRIAYRNRQVTVTGNWGFATVPDDVAHAAALTVVHWMAVNVATFRHPDLSPDASGVQPPRRGIPPEALQILAGYKRMALG